MNKRLRSVLTLGVGMIIVSVLPVRAGESVCTAAGLKGLTPTTLYRLNTVAENHEIR